MKNTEELEQIKKDLLLKGNVYTFEVDVEDKAHTFYFKKPGRHEIAMIQKGLMSDSIIKGVETFVRVCYLGGDEQNLLFKEENFDALRSVESGMLELIRVKPVEIKKN